MKGKTVGGHMHGEALFREIEGTGDRAEQATAAVALSLSPAAAGPEA